MDNYHGGGLPASPVILLTGAGVATAVLCAAASSARQIQLRRDGADFKEAGHLLLDWLAAYRSRCDSLPTVSQVRPNYTMQLVPSSPPEHPEPWSAVIADLDRVIVPGLTHWESERFFAYFKPHASYPAVLGETVCAGLNVMGFDWIASPACTEIEQRV